MNELKLIYFSPTGTTHKVVMETARSIDLKSVSFDLTIKKDLKPVAKFAPNDFALFAIPVYYGRVPALFLKYLDLFSGNGTPAALVATYGCREYEDALLELKTEVEKRGFKVIGAAAFPAEHSIVNSIGARRPNKADLKEASEYGISLNRIIKKEDSFASFDLKVPTGITEDREILLTENTEKTYFFRKPTFRFVQNAAPAQRSVRQEQSLLIIRKRQITINVSDV